MAIPNRLARLAANPSGAVYGTIVAASVIAAAGAHDAEAGPIALTTVLTPALSIVFLLLGAAGLYSAGLAVNLALANGVVQLLLWGMPVARRVGWSWPATMVAGAVDASFGVAVIALKALVH
jgi:hypothetical protein